MTETVIRTEADRQHLIEAIKALNLEKQWRVEVKQKTRRRSLSQNNLYWQWVDVAGKELGYDKTDMDRELKRHCDAPREAYKGLDGTDQWRYSTSKSDTPEMAAYMDRVYRFIVGEFGILLPLPEERWAA